ncbi:MAG: GDP-mannose dehydrogenase, partial [Chloroflexota bacterium]
VVAVKSTVVPGTTEGVIGPTVWAAAGQGVENIGLAMNPEFLREGDAVADFLAPDRIVVGAIDARSAEVMRELYAPFNAPLFITNPRTAEMIKYTSNALLATLISFSNQIAAICEATPDVDVQTVMDAVHMDRRLTPVMGGRPVQPGILAYLRAGAGFGGSCLPKDVKALRAYARAVHAPTELLDAVLAINDQRPRHLVKLAENALGSLAGRTVAVLGLTFKPGSDDLRDSPALRVVELLQEAGAHVRGYDPMITPDGAAQHSLHMSANGNSIEICTSARQALTNADAALITTGWRDFASLDWSEMASVMRMPIVVDGRRILDGAHGLDGVTLLKIGYKAI